jgi:photosystem II stability/assembly factor-like uncharacterized protein
LRNDRSYLGRSQRRLFVSVIAWPHIVAALALSFLLAPKVIGQTSRHLSARDDAIEQAVRFDAALAAVCFVNPTTGWAVGDHGVIWHTRDGGENWLQQLSGASCWLNAVTFIDSRRGWVVGGEHLPYADATRGIVLRTLDGGATWSRVPNLLLPLLTGVKFFDAHVGVAFGIGNGAQPSGVFTTRDGGTTWQPLPADHAGQWLAGDFLDAGAGAIAGGGGRFATLARQRVVHSPLATSSMRSFHAMRLVAPTNGWIVGDGGLVMSTSDLGRSWQSPAAGLPGNADQSFDFHALAVRGSHVWVAGSPGTRIFHSPDGGASWHSFATGQFAPIRALVFGDAQHGWAVGELGSILATRDGGQTWQVQRAGGRRAALLAIFADATDVPLALLAQHGAAESYIAAVDVLFRSNDDAVAGEMPAPLRAREALLLAGAAAVETAWRFPLPRDELAIAPSDLLNALNRANDGQGLKQFENYLVRQLRMWRPEVVVTHHALREADDPAATLVEQAVLRCVEAAADPSRFAELSAAGLEPWQVKKVYGVLPPGVRGDVTVDPNRVSAWLGETPSEWAAPGRHLLFSDCAPLPDAIELKQLAGNCPSAGEPAGLFGGVPLAYGSDARRPASAPPAEDIEDVRRIATRRRQLRELLARTEGNAAWVAQVATLTDGLDAESGGQLLFQLAEGYRAAGRLDLAADTYFLFARRYPEHPLVDRALKWLVQFYASVEAAHRAAADRPTNVRHVVHEEANGEGSRRGDGETGKGGDQEIGRNSPPLPLSPSPTLDRAADRGTAIGLSRDDRLRRAVQLAEYLNSSRPLLYAEPALRFAEVVAQRQLGFSNEAKRYFLALGQLPESDPWRRCATTEQWLASPGETPPPKALAACRRAAVRPHLDGSLDEPLWEAADVLRLHGDSLSAADSPRSQVQLTYDSEFLYLAVSSLKDGSGDYRPDDRPRPRDADLREHDRVELHLDLDRDYTTAFELAVDHRGWCHDACWGDANWNPTWYIAAEEDDISWIVEAAIPLAELTADPPAAKQVWAASVQRIIPRVGCESWSGEPGGAESPERFGLVIFE